MVNIAMERRPRLFSQARPLQARLSMLIVEKMTRGELEVEFLKNDELYSRLDEKRFLASDYGDDELREVLRAWVAEGDECQS
jgi:hypothetical protein